MRSKGTETGDTLEGDPPEDEGGVSSSVPSGGVSHWTQEAPPLAPRVGPSTSDMLFVNLEETYPSSPPFLERDPNMSSAARYSPLHHAPLPSHYQAQPPSYLPHYVQHIMHSERLPPLLQVMGEEAPPPEAPYFPPLGAGPDIYRLSSSAAPPAPYLPRAAHILDTAQDLHLILASNGEYHMIDGSGMKAEHVERLITGGQSGVSYSLSSENGFIVARPTVTSCTTDPKDPVDVITESSSMTVDVSLLDSLDEGSQFDEDQSIVMEAETLDSTNLHLDISQSDELVLPHESDPISPSQLEDVGCEEMVGFEDIAEYLEQESSQSPSPEGRNRRRQHSPLSDDNTIMCIPDKSVPCRARASLPAAHLCMGRAGGVFARRRIPARARFGPLEGVRRPLPSAPRPHQPGLHLMLHTPAGDYCMDVSDEKTSNWMRYVRFEPGPSQNVCLQQSGSELYFISYRPIPPRQELVLGYSSDYSSRWGLPPPPPHAAGNEDTALEWPCYECSMMFASSPELQAHLNMHDEDDKKSAAIRRPKKKVVKTVTSTEYRCDICSRVFPRSFSLKRHKLTHANITEITAAKINELSSIELNECSQPEEIQTVSFHISDGNMEIDTTTDMTANDKGFGIGSSLKTDEQLVPEAGDGSCIEPPLGQEPPPVTRCPPPLIPAPVDVDSTTQYPNQRKNANKTENTRTVVTPTAAAKEPPAKKTNKGGKEPGVRVSALGVLCLMCPRTFSHTWMLKDHTQSHHRSADGRFDCPMCEMRLPDYASIKKHIRGFHAVRRFSCQLCATNFSSSDKLKMHMLKHSEHREFLCPDCGKQFKRKDKLKDHIKKIHNSTKKDSEAVTKVTAGKPAAASPPADPTAYLSFTFKCHPCKLGFKRRGMLVNHLARRHPEVARASVPELQLPILRAARDYYCQYCYKIYKSSSKRKAHILKNHPGETVPPSSRGVSLPTGGSWAAGYSACVGAVPSAPHHCPHQPCHKQYASKAKLLQHIRLNHGQQNITADSNSKENSGQMNNCKIEDKDEAPISKGDVSSSTNSLHPSSGKLQVLNSDNKMPRTAKGNIFSQNGETEKVATQNILLKSEAVQSSHSPPSFGPASKSHRILSGLFNRMSSSSPNLKKQNLPDHIPVKPLTEIKLAGFSGSLKQASKTEWKSSSDSQGIMEILKNGGNRLRLVQLCDAKQLLEGSGMGQTVALKREQDVPAHKLHPEGSKLPPVSELACRSGKGGAMTRYTDR